MKIVPIILAGGIGERFWPLSRSSTPKQLLPLISSKSMIEETLSRVGPFCKKGTRPIIVTGRKIAGKIKQTLSTSIACDYIVETVGKNTAPAVAIAAAWISKKYSSDTVMVVLSADHAISPKKDFINAGNYAIKLASSLDTLIVFGIPPSRPDTGYGYIQLGKKLDRSGHIESFKVKRFVEKPTLKKAKQYISSKEYLWNSGMFVWKASVILEEFKQHMPSIYQGVVKAAKHGFNQKAIDTFYHTSEKQSIDYGIMEQSRRVAAVKGLFKWDDLGSWESLSRVLSQNKKQTTVSGKRVFEKDCLRVIITNNSDMTVATIGLKDTAVVAVDDAVLVIARDKLPELRKYLAEMKSNSKFPRKLF